MVFSTLMPHKKSLSKTTSKRITQAINDTDFDDVEDSFQYQCALQNNCNALITINLRDYRNVNTSKIEILSPTEFVKKYL